MHMFLHLQSIHEALKAVRLYVSIDEKTTHVALHTVTNLLLIYRVAWRR